MIDYLILILLLVVIVILFWLGRSYATINTTEKFSEESYNEGYNDGCVKGYEQAIEKACEWLCEYNRKQANKMFDTVHTYDVTINVAQFRKAMKGGEQ